jgi:hypothetical protein
MSNQFQQQDGQGQSQEQGGRPADKTPRTTADPGADGQSVYDLQDEEAREQDDPQPVRPRPALPDSNAM